MFASNSTGNLKVLDTFKIDQNGIFLKDLHIQRTQKAFAFFRNALSLTSDKDSDLKNILPAYDAIEKLHTKNLNQRIRIVFNVEDYSSHYSIHNLESISQPVLLEVIQTLRQPSGCGQQNFKWETRDYWDQIIQLRVTSATDVISLNELGNCVETSRCNLFFYDHVSDLVSTPSLNSGCISGVFREWVISRGQIELPGVGIKSIRESEIHFSNLNNYQLFIANSVRGVLSAGLAT